MGATEFTTVSFGKTADEAFKAAKDEAYYLHGREGYTGTIAEKDSYTVVALPKGVTVARALKWLETDLQIIFCEQDIKMHWVSHNCKEQAKKQLSQLRKKRCPTKHRMLVQRMVDLAGRDKWGPCLCLEFKGNENRTMKEKNGKKGKRGSYYYFAGIASE